MLQKSKTEKSITFLFWITFPWKFLLNTSIPNNWSSSPRITYTLTKPTNNSSLVVRGRDKLHLLLPVQAYNPSFLCFVWFNCLKHCSYKKKKNKHPTFLIQDYIITLHFGIYHLESCSFDWSMDNNSFALKICLISKNRTMLRFSCNLQ